MIRKYVWVALVAALVSCQQKGSSGSGPVPGTVGEQLSQPLDLNKAIVQTPAKIVSVVSPIDIVFRDAVVPAHLAGTTLDRSPFEFKPHIDGYARWVGQSRLSFTPSKPLTPGTSYDGVLKGRLAFGEQRPVNDFTFAFKTAEQEVVDFEGDFEPDNSGTNMVRFKGGMSFAQAVVVDKLAKHLVCRSPRNRIGLVIKPDASDPAKVTIVSEPVKREDKGQMLTFTLPEEYTVEHGTWTRELLLPEANVFRVLATMDMSDPKAQQSTYAFRFSDPVKPDMDLSAFVSINPDLPHTVAVSGKYLKVSGDFSAGADYSITVAAGLPSALGTTLAKTYTVSVQFTNVKPAIEWLSKGIFLPSADQYKLQFKSVNVATARITVTEVFENNLGFFLQNNALQEQRNGSRGGSNEEEGDEEDYYGSSGSISDLDRVGKQIYNDTLKLSSERNKWLLSELDLGKVFKGKHNSAFVVTLTFGMTDLCGKCVSNRNDLKEGDLYYEEDNYYSCPCQSGYYYNRGTTTKLLIASDISLTVKQAADGCHVYAINIADARPASGLSLGLYSYQNQLLHRATTDNDGHVLFTETDGHYVRGEDSKSLALIRLDQSPWDLSGYDVAGASQGASGLNVFIYTERGVHRPGDTVYLAAVVRTDRKAPPAEQPVEIKVYNPQNQVVHEAAQKCGENGHVYFAIPTAITDPTGEWRAELKVAGQTFSHPLKIETVKPNRLKVLFDIPDTSMPGESVVSGSVQSRYLFGTPAAGLRAHLQINLSSSRLSIPALADYTFTHPLRRYEARREEVSDDALDAQGVRRVSYRVPDAGAAPEILAGVLQADVYEKGGGYTSQSKRVTIVPYKAFVGVKNIFGWRGAQVGEHYALPIVAADVHGRMIAGHKLIVKWYLNRKYWWYDYDSRNHADFRTLKNTYKISEQTIVSGATPATFAMDVEDNGQHFIEVTDKETGHTAGFFFWASGYGQTAPTSEDKQERPSLTIATDKNFYTVGDKASITFATPRKGVAIFSVEQGARILQQDVRAVTDKQTSISFDLTEEYVPNCYVVVSLIQPLSQRENEAPLRVYGVKPLAVEDAATRLQLGVTAPDEIKPNAQFDVVLSSQSAVPATATVAVVDEGLLDLTGFMTPDPWSFFYQHLGLGVITRDNCDQILGLLLPGMDRFFSIGGDLEAERNQRAGESRVQRFKPTVLYQKPILVPPHRNVNVSFSMPNYVGSVRIMVVAAAQNSYASIEKTVPVRQPLMVLPTVPRVGRPGDRFQVPVSVFAMDSTVREVRVTLSVTDNMQVVGEQSQSVSFKGPGETDISFAVRVKEQIGEGVVTVKATDGTHAAFDTTHLPITCPNPYYTRVTDTTAAGATALVLVPHKVGIEGTNKAGISFTRMPDIQLQKRLKCLIEYPYGCIEQTVSSAFPQLYLGSLIDLTSVQKREVTDNVNAAIERLGSFRISGGFSYWPASSWYQQTLSEWGTDYAGHFLIEAKAAGFHVPDDLFDHWLSSAQSRAKEASDDHRCQAYRLFLLASAGKPNQGAMNLMRENYLHELDPLSKKLLAASFSVAGQKDAGQQIDKQTNTEITTYREMSGTFGSDLRDRAMIAYLAYTMGDQATAARVMKAIAKEFRPDGWYSTQEQAMALLAISTIYAKSSLGGGSIPFTLAAEGKRAEKLLVKGYQLTYDASDLFDKKITITSEGSDPLFVTLFEEGIPLQDFIKTSANGMELTRNFYNEDGQPITLTQITQGTAFWVRYRVRSTTREELQNLALTSLFPSGWEIVNPRMETAEPPVWVQNYSPSWGTYMDVRDDRVNWFFNLGYNAESNFLIKLHPTFAGAYRLPPVVVEPMYSPNYYARIAGDSVVVK